MLESNTIADGAMDSTNNTTRWPSASGCSPRSSSSAPPRLRLPPSVGRLKPTADARNVVGPTWVR
eukprot:scaffold1216_cov60-Phaeocystis_antarctica.AAC.2